MGTRWARFARGWLAAVVSTAVAAASHTFAGGPPSWLAIVLSLVFAGMLCVGLAGKRLSPLRLAASVVGSQLLFHQLFASIGGSGWAPAAHVHGAEITGALGLTVPTGSSQLVSAADATWMLAAHAAAAAVTFLLLCYGERSFWSVTAGARALLRVLFPRELQPVPLDAARPPKNLSRVLVLSPKAKLSVLRYRGPPAGSARAFA
ncbi:hypothetical protein GCM10027052_10960 [Parafrigoribacterium mesophilum]|uniref:hypothetical protein n=1 Tax=Parafrigoribacterium mesophilum TaxID=433646 RepID=UPI0031FE1C06